MANNFLKNVTQSFQALPVGVGPILEPLADDVLGFTLIGAQTTIPNQELRAIATKWAAGQYEKRRNNTSLIAKSLCQFPWSWDAFDRMIQVLRQDDLWPMPWHLYEQKIKLGLHLDEVRAKILIQSARTASASIRLSKNKSFLTMLSLDGWHLYTDSEVGAHYVSKFVADVRSSDPKTWPPLYPGDLSTIKTGSEGVYSRLGKFFGLVGSRPFWADPYD